MSTASSTSAIVPQKEDRRLRRIVVGTDFSDASAHALRFACDLALIHHAELIIVNAIDPMIATLETSVQAIVDDLRKGLQQAAAMAGNKGVTALTRQDAGKAWWVINEVAMQSEADLVIVASQGHTAGHSRLAEGLARLLGGTTDRVVRSCHAPVLVVPTTSATSPAQWQQGVIGVDFSAESAMAASAAARLLANPSGPASTPDTAKRRLILFHTIVLAVEFRGLGGVDAPLVLPETTPDHWERAEAAASERLETWAAALRTDRLVVECVTMRGYAPDAILHAARTRNADLIALGTHGLGAINRMLLGSVAERVLHHAACPVLTVRHPG